MPLHVNSSPMACSVMLWDGDRAPVSHGIAEASNVGSKPGEWYLNRVKVNTQGQGLGSMILAKLLETLKARADFQSLIVEPGGYGSDVNRLVKFYEAHGFRHDPKRKCWIWTVDPAAPGS